MALDKDRVHELVEIFYQKPPFKTFYINSTDGSNFTKPTGVFISLGITTSFKVLSDLKEVLEKTPNIKSEIVEIESVKVAGQFMNHIVKKGEEANQYVVSEETVLPSIVLNEAEANKELMDLEEQLKTNLEKHDDYLKLREAINRVTESSNPWVDQKVMKLTSGGYRVFHRLVNYTKTNDKEYRLGIYVEEIN